MLMEKGKDYLLVSEMAENGGSDYINVRMYRVWLCECWLIYTRLSSYYDPI